LKDAQTPTQTTTPPNPSPQNDPAASKPPSEPTGAPDTYTFRAPDGTELDKSLTEAATPIFKELGLTQAAAGKLVDFYNAQMKSQADVGLKAVLALREKWVGEVKSDPELGSKLDTIKADIGRAFDTLGDPKLVDEFKSAMDLTGAGDNPAFIRAFWKLSQRVIEGKPVGGGGPSPHGQQPSGMAKKPSLASAMYPNLSTNQ
jgi:hypothetical protein